MDIATDADCQPVSENWIVEMMKNAVLRIKLFRVSPITFKKGLLNSLIEYETAQTAL